MDHRRRQGCLLLCLYWTKKNSFPLSERARHEAMDLKSSKANLNQMSKLSEWQDTGKKLPRETVESPTSDVFKQKVDKGLSGMGKTQQIAHLCRGVD